jgi:uncharacterized membrane protein HdeD (DUF308 family)
MIAGVLLLIAGIFCFAHPGEKFLSAAFLLGCAMLIAGTLSTFVYIWYSMKGEISDFIGAEGLLSAILGCLVLFNQLLADAAIPVFFGIWVMFSGIIRAVEAYAGRKSGWLNLAWLLTLGVLGVAAGLYAFFNTEYFAFSPVMLTGILFVVQGVNVLLVGANLYYKPRQSHLRKGQLT